MSYKVFVSYSWSNSAERRALKSELSTLENVSVLVDKDSIKLGDQIHSIVNEMIDAADCVIVFLTREGLGSHEVRDEISRTHDRKKLLIPVVQSDTPLEELPWYIRDVNYIRYDSRNFDEVIDSVRARIDELANPLRQLDESRIPANIRNLLQSGKKLIIIPMFGYEDAKSRDLRDYLLCELRMRQSDAVFPFAAHPKATVEDVATALAREVNPHLYHQDYEWMLVKGEKNLPGWMSLKSANLLSGDSVLLLGNHRRPEWAPSQ